MLYAIYNVVFIFYCTHSIACIMHLYLVFNNKILENWLCEMINQTNFVDSLSKWNLSLSRIYIYLYNIYYCFLGVWTVKHFSLANTEDCVLFKGAWTLKEFIQCCFPPSSSFSIVLPSLNMQLPWRSLIVACGTNRHQSNEDVLIHSSTV